MLRAAMGRCGTAAGEQPRASLRMDRTTWREIRDSARGRVVSRQAPIPLPPRRQRDASYEYRWRARAVAPSRRLRVTPRQSRQNSVVDDHNKRVRMLESRRNAYPIVQCRSSRRNCVRD